MFTPFRATSRLAPAGFRTFSSTPRAQLARMSLVGRLGVSPEEVTVSNDRTLVRYVIGTGHGKAEDRKTSWFRVASFVSGPQKDYLMGIPKGSLVYVDADARMDAYTDAEGNKRSSLSLIAKNVDVIIRGRGEDASPETNEEGIVQEASG
ncbi:ssDNA binding protein-like protein [Amniculicola lignicola CBS 123094]|uniref:Single-stranded DNA-binding protein n=1 Tax=Amniculicola lignicola CBS 123094 TaxID=1392246 RepID=A0A6A5WW75_9PLEO|nr:ssDNA binding protein-like protein [Amniculicola lignicola CBS 123094]